MTNHKSYIVVLEPGVWLADGEGDPPRTLKRENAKRFATLADARRGLTIARKVRPFKNAGIAND